MNNLRPIRRLIFSLVLLVVCLAPVAGKRVERRIDGWRPTDYSVSIILDRALSQIAKATTTVSVKVLRDGLKEVDLDFGDLTVDAVTVNRRPAKFERSSGKLNVALPRPARNGDTLAVSVTYRGLPKNGLMFTNDKDRKPSVIGDNWPNRVHHWLPSLDHPSAKATISFSVTAPKENVVVANGRFVRVSNLPNGNRTWEFRESVPIPTYCMIFAAGQFSRIEGDSTITPLEYFVPYSDASFAAKGFAPAAPSLKYFSETIGPYPYEKLALIVGATQFGGMENSTAIVFRSNLFGPGAEVPTSKAFGIRSGIVELIAHEVAHQWFGDSVTAMTWADLWLSEGFANYFAGLFVQKYEGETPFREYMNRNAVTYFNYARQRRTPLHDTETENLFRLLNGNNYQKGAWVLHMLRAELGDQAFFAGLRAYYAKYRDANATSEDLRAVLEKTSGKDLTSFFTSWVYGAGHPNYELTWEWSAEKKILHVRLRQLQPEGSFSNALPIEITHQDGSKARLVLLPRTKDEKMDFPLNDAPVSLVVDPDATVLKEITVKESLSQ